MKSILMTTSAVFLVTGLAAAAQAACPEDIDAFNREYQQTLQSAEAGQALSTSEQAQLFGLQTAAQNLYSTGEADTCAVVIKRARSMLESAIAPQVIKPSELVGRKVANTAGEDLGEIEDVMLDPVTGRIAYVVLEHGGFLGIGDDLFAVPWRAITYVPGDDKSVLLDIPEERLENAPRFSRKDESPLERREWVTAVHNYYGVDPYWQDNVSALAMQQGGQQGGAAAPAAITEGQEAGTQQPQTGTAEPMDVVIVAPVTETDSTGTASTGASDTSAGSQSGASSEASAGTQPGAGSGAGEQMAAAPNQTADQQQAQPDQQQGQQAAPTPVTGSATDQGPTTTEGQALLAPEPGGQAQGTQAETGAAAQAVAVPSGEVDRLIERIDQLEQRMQELSQSGVGQDVEQSIASLEQEVQQLAQRGPGQEVTQAIQRLESEVQQLSQQEPGQEVTQAISRLEEQVQQLSDQGVGNDIRQQLASIEERLSALGTTGSEGATGQGQPAAAAAAPDQQAQPQQQPQQQPQPSEQPQPTDQQSMQSQTGASGDQSAQPQAAAPQEGQQAGQTPSADQGNVIQGTTVPAAPAAPAAAPGADTSGASGDTAAASGEPCEKMLEVLQADLTRAEKLGVAINDARSEYKEAQAMLNNNSEALCRAAIRRAHDELVAVGFEPTEMN